MANSNSLTYFLTLPLAAMVLSWVLPKGLQRLYAIFASISLFIITLYQTFPILFLSNTHVGAIRPAIDQKLSWIPEMGVNLSLRLDFTSAWFLILTTITTLLAFSLRGTWFRKHPRLFTSLGFFLTFALNAAFLSQDLVVFYLSYEAVFIPMIFMVGIWGDNQKALSVFRFFLMSFLGSILMLVSIFYLIYAHHAQTGVYSAHVNDLVRLVRANPTGTFRWAYFGFFLAFAIKVPLVPFHGWLREVYVNAPMPGTIWMSGILSKLGVFGMIQFLLPIFGDLNIQYQSWLVLFATLSVIYAAFLAIKSESPKELLAYSSISHLGFVMLGVFTLKTNGSTSAILLSISHTVVSALLFYLLHQIEERRGVQSLSQFHGSAKRYPILFVMLFVVTLSSVSLPGTLGFCGEFLVLLVAYPVSALCTILSGLGVILGAIYMLKFYQRLGLGTEVQKAEVSAGAGRDLGAYDFIIVLFFVLALIYFGFQPMILLRGN